MMADSFPKFREKLTPTIRGFFAASAVILPQVLSEEPSLTKISSKSIPSA